MSKEEIKKTQVQKHIILLRRTNLEVHINGILSLKARNFSAT